MACISNDESDIVLLCEIDSSNYMVGVRNIDSIRHIVSDQAGS